MARAIFRDFDEFADRINGVAGRFIPTARTRAPWWVAGAQLSALSLQQLQIGGPATFAGGGEPGRYAFGVTMSDVRQVRIDGRQMERNGYLLLTRARQSFAFAGLDVVRWTVVSLQEGNSLLPEDLIASLQFDDQFRLRAQMSALECLRGLVTRACDSTDQILRAGSTATAGVEQDISMALVQLMEHSRRAVTYHQGRPQVSRSRVIARLLGLIEASQGEALLINDLCNAAGVSERTLRNICHEMFGVSPMRLLKTRQLHEVRRALLQATADEETVMAVVSRFGIWDLSLFARNYRQLFGETPSQTLQSPAREYTDPMVNWLHYAWCIFDRGQRQGAIRRAPRLDACSG